MSHLGIETLARLVDETPDSHEAEHLQACQQCSTELEGLKADAAALAALPALAAPPAHWVALEGRLADEGLLQRRVQHMPARWLRPALQLAAAIVVFVLGNYSGPLFARDAVPEQSVASNGVPVEVVERPVMQQANQTQPGATLAAQNSPSVPRNREDAAAQVREAEQAYLSALTRYAEMAGRTEASDPVARLAALESIVLTTRAALGQAPTDPVINGYHLTALAQREATLKQMASAAGKTWF